MSIIQFPLQLGANPHYYDYLHIITFAEDHTVEMLDGGGQVINSLIKGQFAIEKSDQSDTITIRFQHLQAHHPYSDEVLESLSDFTCQLTKETGQFVFRREVVWKIDDPEQHPYLLFKTRYVFDRDPLDSLMSHDHGNLYQALESKDFDQSLRFYYSSPELDDVTLADLKRLGIDIDSDSEK